MRPLLLLLLAGCTSDALDQPAYVLLDARAREAGVAVRIGDDEISSALPIAFDPGDDVALVFPPRSPGLPAPGELDDEQSLDVYAGDLVVVRSDVVQLHTLGEDVSANAARLRGDLDLIAALAVEAGAGDLSPTGDGYVVVGPEVISELSQLPEPEGDVEIDVLAPQDDATEATIADSASEGRKGRERALSGVARSFHAPGEGRSLRGESAAAFGIDLQAADAFFAFGAAGDGDMAGFVGVYRSGTEDLVLDAQGRFWREADGVKGAWTVDDGLVVLHPDGEAPEELEPSYRPL